MKGRLAVVALVLAVGAGNLRAQQQLAPRDIWPQATAAAREGDLDTATKKKNELLAAGRTYGIRTFPVYAAGASAWSSKVSATQPDLAAWAERAARELDGRSPAVAFSEADRAKRTKGWGGAVPPTGWGRRAV